MLSIVIKSIGKQRYAYQAYRNGTRVAQRYLGNVADKNVEKRIAGLQKGNQVQRRFYPLFWDVDPGKISIRGKKREQ